MDTVLYFEGEATLDYRLLRATKNRFGSVDELGVFSMTGHGLVAGAEPLRRVPGRARRGHQRQRRDGADGRHPPGAGRGAGARGALGLRHAAAGGHRPRPEAARRAARGARTPRRTLPSPTLDVFVQATAGVRLAEPGADLAVAAALLSSLHGRPVPADVLYLGEIGLGGEMRPISGIERRMTEAARLGFRRVFAAGAEPALGAGHRRRRRGARRPAGEEPCRLTSGSIIVAAGQGSRVGGDPEAVSRTGRHPGPAPRAAAHSLPIPTSPARSASCRRNRRPRHPSGWRLSPAIACASWPAGPSGRIRSAPASRRCPVDCAIVLVHDGGPAVRLAGHHRRRDRGARARASARSLPFRLRDTLKDGARTAPRTAPWSGPSPRDGLWRAQTPQGFPRACSSAPRRRPRRRGRRPPTTRSWSSASGARCAWCPIGRPT